MTCPSNPYFPESWPTGIQAQVSQHPNTDHRLHNNRWRK